MNEAIPVFVICGIGLVICWALIVIHKMWAAPILWIMSGVTIVFSIFFGFIVTLLTLGHFDPMKFVTETMRTVQSQAAIFLVTLIATALYIAALFVYL